MCVCLCVCVQCMYSAGAHMETRGGHWMSYFITPTLFPGDNFSTALASKPQQSSWLRVLTPSAQGYSGVFMWELGFEVRSSGRYSYLLSPLGLVVVLEWRLSIQPRFSVPSPNTELLGQLLAGFKGCPWALWLHPAVSPGKGEWKSGNPWEGVPRTPSPGSAGGRHQIRTLHPGEDGSDR